jgi:hypothetical protein
MRYSREHHLLTPSRIRVFPPFSRGRRFISGSKSTPPVVLAMSEQTAMPLDRGDKRLECFGGAPTEKRELAPATGRAVEPQHHLARRITVFGIAQSTAVGEVQASFGAGLFDAWHAHRVSPGLRGR